MNIIQGFQDILPDRLEQKRFCEQKLVQIFQQWGYREINTPTLEYYDILAQGIGPELRKKMYKLLNSEGDIIVLRPDMTTPIARVAATKLTHTNNDFHKLYYLNNIFRKSTSRMEEQQEFYQAGIELIGLNNPWADAEVIAVAVKALLNTGLQDFYIDIGSAKFFNAIMAKLPLSAEDQKAIRQSIMDKDFVQLERLLYHSDIPKKEQEMILHLPHWRGNKAMIQEAINSLKKDNPTACQALREMNEVYRYLQAYQLDRYILIDLGMIRNFDYYTGIVFEGYTTQVGSAICGGGRYDQLCQKFGQDLPSTGIAINIEKLLQVLLREQRYPLGPAKTKKYFIRFKNNLLPMALKLAQDLRNEGNITEMELLKGRSRDQALQYARLKKMDYFIDMCSEDWDQVSRFNLKTNKEESLNDE
mgnify:CR=1 FL=1